VLRGSLPWVALMESLLGLRKSPFRESLIREWEGQISTRRPGLVK
jgi:hypothetical protein